MNRGCAWAIAVVIGLSGLWAAPVDAQPVELSTSVALESTYVFRGIPQYIKDDTPSLLLSALGELEHGPGYWWFEAWTALVLADRSANGRLGSSDEFDISLGYAWDIHPRVQWTFGAVDYVRPSNDPVNFRLEAMTRITWLAFESELWTLKPYASVHGEALELLGAYGEVGLEAKADLGEGFVLTTLVGAGGSRYLEGDADFNHVEGGAVLTYTLPMMPELTIAGHMSLSLSQRDIGIGTKFFEKHGVVWSGLSIGYSVQPGRSRPEPPKPDAISSSSD